MEAGPDACKNDSSEMLSADSAATEQKAHFDQRDVLTRIVRRLEQLPACDLAALAQLMPARLLPDEKQRADATVAGEVPSARETQAQPALTGEGEKPCVGAVL